MLLSILPVEIHCGISLFVQINILVGDRELLIGADKVKSYSLNRLRLHVPWKYSS